jgi:hypothetical protein
MEGGMTDIKPEPKPRHPPEILALWHRQGNWKKAPDKTWQLIRNDVKRFHDLGWAQTAYELGWTPNELYGLRLAVPGSKRPIEHLGMACCLHGGYIIMMDTNHALYQHGCSRKTFTYRRPLLKATSGKTAA